MERVTEILLLVLFLLSPSAFAQKKQGAARLDSLLAEVPKMKEDTTGALLLDAISLTYMITNPDEGKKWAEKELALVQKIGWRKGEAWARNSIGSNLQMRGDYSEALEAYFKSLRIDEEIKDTVGLGNVSASIGNIYTQLGQNEKALKWQRSALRFAEIAGNKRTIAQTLINISSAYIQMGMPDTALSYQERALVVAEEIGNIATLFQAHGNLGNTYMSMGSHNLALKHFVKAKRLTEELGSPQFGALTTGNMGIVYWLIGRDSLSPKPDSLVPASRASNLAKAAFYLREAIVACEKSDAPQGIPEFRKTLADVLHLQGDYKGALETYITYVQAKDSLDQAATLEKITAMETQRELQIKDKDIRIAELEVAKKRNERVFLMGGIILLLLVLVLLLYNFRRYKRSRRHIKELQDYKISQLDEAVKRRTEQLDSMRQTIASDFHDQTGNMLAAIARQASTLEIRLLQQPQFLPAIRSIIENSNELYASSKDFLWNLNQDSDDPLILLQYLSGYGQRFYNQFDISFSNTVSGVPQTHLQLHPFAGLNLIYIFKEAMSNVVKHSGADEVDLEMHWEPERVVYALHDNGVWKEADPSVEHYGLHNMERRCQQSGFSYSLNHDQSGTRICIGLALNAYHTQPVTS